MSRKHAHRADNQPVTRRYVRSVVQRARDEIISAIVHAHSDQDDPPFVAYLGGRTHVGRQPEQDMSRLMRREYGLSPTEAWLRSLEVVPPTPERLERAVNGRES